MQESPKPSLFQGQSGTTFKLSSSSNSTSSSVKSWAHIHTKDNFAMEIRRAPSKLRSVLSWDFACLQSQWNKSNTDWKIPAQAAATYDSISSFPTPAWHMPLRRFSSPHYTLQALFPWFDDINVFISKPHLCLHLVCCPAAKRKYVINFREHWTCWCWERWCFSIMYDLLTCLTDNFILQRCPKS